jgi:hypothetical protein
MMGDWTSGQRFVLEVELERLAQVVLRSLNVLALAD